VKVENIEELLLDFPRIFEVRTHVFCNWQFYEAWHKAHRDDAATNASLAAQLIVWDPDFANNRGLRHHWDDDYRAEIFSNLMALGKIQDLSISCPFALPLRAATQDQHRGKRRLRVEDEPKPVGQDWPQLVIFSTDCSRSSRYAWEGLELTPVEYGWGPTPHLLRTQLIQQAEEQTRNFKATTAAAKKRPARTNRRR